MSKDSKLEELTLLNAGGGDLVKQFTEAKRQVHKNWQRFGGDAEHTIMMKVRISNNLEKNYPQNSCQTTISCKVSESMTGANSPLKIDSKGIFDANNQLEFPAE